MMGIRDVEQSNYVRVIVPVHRQRHTGDVITSFEEIINTMGLTSTLTHDISGPMM